MDEQESEKQWPQLFMPHLGWLAWFIALRTIFDWQAIRDHGFKWFLYDTVGGALSVAGVLILAWVMGRIIFHGRITTLGLGGVATKKIK